MKTEPFQLENLSKPKAALAKNAVRKPAPAKPTAWGQGVLKKIEQFRLALALEK